MYDFKSFLGKLFQALTRNEPQSVECCFEKLSEKLKEAVIAGFRQFHVPIRSSSIPSCSSSIPQLEDDLNLFENLALLGRTVREKVDQSFASLSDNKKNAIYLEISRLAGDEGNLDWGKEHAFDQMAHFIEAYANVMDSNRFLPPKAKRARIS